jgi:tetratricopeptide (TPR) repeat protein
MGHPDQALESYGKALAIQDRLARENPSVTAFQSDLAGSHYNIGSLQRATGHPDQALNSYGKALAINERLARENPSVTEFQRNLALSHNNIGLLQSDTGHPDQALESYGKALAIFERLARENPSVTEFQRNLAGSHNNIGLLQWATGHPDQALESYGKALSIRDRLAKTHHESPDYASDLGATLNNMATIDLDAKRFPQARDRLQQAISWQEKALAANPRHPTYRQFLRYHLGNLVTAARALDNYAEVSAAQRELDELAATDPAQAALDTRMSAVLRGEPPGDNGERLQLAYRGYEKGLYAVSARLYTEALEANPKFGDDRQRQHRYNAACAAALAAGPKNTPNLPSTIKGDEKTQRPSSLVVQDGGAGAEKPLTDADRAKFREQARTWLEAELAVWTNLLASANGQKRQAIVGTLKHWQQDTDLASVRDETALTKMPENERKAWKSLWANVNALLNKAGEP